MAKPKKVPKTTRVDVIRGPGKKVTRDASGTGGSK